jgi:hypothetical protein
LLKCTAHPARRYYTTNVFHHHKAMAGGDFSVSTWRPWTLVAAGAEVNHADNYGYAVNSKVR